MLAGWGDRNVLPNGIHGCFGETSEITGAEHLAKERAVEKAGAALRDGQSPPREQMTRVEVGRSHEQCQAAVFSRRSA